MDEFKLVKPKSKARKKTRDDVNNVVELFNKVENCKQRLKSNDSELYASKTIYTLKELVRNRFKSEAKICVFCYGLGSFDDSLASRYQFALLLLIIDAFKEENRIDMVELYDPKFSEADLSVIESHYKLKIASVNEKAMRSVEERSEATLVFMPHCPKALYNNLLFSNWSIDRLSRLIIFGNSFNHLRSLGVDDGVYSYLNDSFELLEEIELDSECECTNAFVDLSLNTFVKFDELKQLRNELKQNYNQDLLRIPFYTDSEEIIQ